MQTEARVLGLITIACFAFAPFDASAECDVQEVIEMVEDDSSTSMIKNACDGSVDVPDCTLSRVIRFARRGDSEDEIYDQCEEDSASEESNDRSRGLPRGAVVQACGCWGFVNIGARDVVPECASGYGIAEACPALCPAGGVQWGIRCL